MSRTTYSALALSAILAAGAPAGARGAALIQRTVVGAGGGGASGASVTFVGSLGQPLVGAAAGGAAAIGSGFWLRIGSPATAVPDGDVIPAAFRFLPNYPNPFNPRTTIAFELPRGSSRVSLRIYDLKGRAVATLVDGPLPAGRHGVAWQAVDDAGRALSSGVYFAQLDTGADRAIHKLTLVR
ncbi:T9SS type A sorting domain-containing protein [bacterium]|nr:T9SS type A sorting domain-containing protein [bacterium]